MEVAAVKARNSKDDIFNLCCLFLSSRISKYGIPTVFPNFGGTTSLYLQSLLKFGNFSFTIFSLFSYTPNESRIELMSIISVFMLYLSANCFASIWLFGSDSFSGMIRPKTFS